MSGLHKKAIVAIVAMFAATMMTACVALDSHEKVILSFKYMAIENTSNQDDFSFVEDTDFPSLIATYEVDRNHVISAEDLYDIGSLTSFIPHNSGGYYVRTMFYSDSLNPSLNNQLTEGYRCVSDTTFYYSYTGGIAQPPESVIFSFTLMDLSVDSNSEFGYSFAGNDTTHIFERRFGFGKSVLQEDIDSIDEEITALLEIGEEDLIFGYFPDPYQLSNESRLNVGMLCLFDQDFFFGILN